jgi:hypothetical protein
MANLAKHDYTKNTLIQPIAAGPEVVCAFATVSIPSTLAASDVASLLLLPADHVPVDLILFPDDLDTGTSLTISVGVLNAGETDLSTTTADGGAVWLASSTGGQTGVLARPTTNVIAKVAPNKTADRKVGVKVILVGSATAGSIRLQLLYRRATGEDYARAS